MSAEIIAFPSKALPEQETVSEEAEGPPVGSEALRCAPCSERLGMEQFAFYCTRQDIRCWVCHEVQVFYE